MIIRQICYYGDLKERKKEGKIEVNIYAGINTTGYVLALTSN